jgi:hypothetical protein
MILRSLRLLALPAATASFAFAATFLSLGCGDSVDVGANRPDDLSAGGSGGAAGTNGGAGTTGCGADADGNPTRCPPTCRTNADCGDKLFCDHTGSTSCGDEGICVVRPEVCTEECGVPGVCGCDGQMHCTTCQANSAGISLAPDPSFCSPPAEKGCGVPGGKVCAANEYCDHAGSASCGDEGTCLPKPEVCAEICQSPMVCGCDGQEYCSACHAQGKGVSLDPTNTACGGTPPVEPCGGAAGLTCGAGKFCDVSGAASCGATGECKVQPQACDAVCDGPAAARCGCDGVLRCSVCDLNAAGVSLSPDPTVCPAPTFKACGDASLPACGADEFCDFSFGNGGSGTCGGTNERLGVCTKRPENCTQECASPQLCGCDGKLYCNACMANAAGTSISGDDTLCAP